MALRICAPTSAVTSDTSVLKSSELAVRKASSLWAAACLTSWSWPAASATEGSPLKGK
ncbi:hypothetical protein [Turicimonas sp. TL08]